MRPLGRNIPWKSISIPWNGRSKGWKYRSKATFRWKNSPDLCHIASKIELLGVRAAVPRKDVPENQAFQFFAYLRAKEQARENIRFSVLKNNGAAGIFRPCCAFAVASWGRFLCCVGSVQTGRFEFFPGQFGSRCAAVSKKRRDVLRFFIAAAYLCRVRCPLWAANLRGTTAAVAT